MRAPTDARAYQGPGRRRHLNGDGFLTSRRHFPAIVAQWQYVPDLTTFVQVLSTVLSLCSVHTKHLRQISRFHNNA